MFWGTTPFRFSITPKMRLANRTRKTNRLHFRLRKIRYLPSPSFRNPRRKVLKIRAPRLRHPYCHQPRRRYLSILFRKIRWQPPKRRHFCQNWARRLRLIRRVALTITFLCMKTRSHTLLPIQRTREDHRCNRRWGINPAAKNSTVQKIKTCPECPASIRIQHTGKAANEGHPRKIWCRINRARTARRTRLMDTNRGTMRDRIMGLSTRLFRRRWVADTRGWVSKIVVYVWGWRVFQKIAPPLWHDWELTSGSSYLFASYYTRVNPKQLSTRCGRADNTISQPNTKTRLFGSSRLVNRAQNEVGTLKLREVTPLFVTCVLHTLSFFGEKKTWKWVQKSLLLP